MAKFIALYLPQYYPTPENDEWWGKGFTDWRSVNMARPLFKGHVQPKYPLDLGYYDLRVPETRKQQADLAKEYGIDAFCYWHYWFSGKEMLDIPFKQVVDSGEPDFPFCLGWANHKWMKKDWNPGGKNHLLIDIEYPGYEDDKAHFYSLLSAFKDNRYFRHDGKLVFIIYDALTSDYIKIFMQNWRSLARKEGIGDFFFITRDAYSKNKEYDLRLGFDAVYNDNIFGVLHQESKVKKGIRYLKGKLFHKPIVINYRDAYKYMIGEEEAKEEVIPSIVPNWDHSPRSGFGNPIFVNSRPEYFEQLVRNACELVKNKYNDLIIVKSWNEWGEGNYLEPDMEYGRGMLEALKRGRGIL